MIREALAGKRVLVTGGTGFLGTALLERLLDLPLARVDVVARGDAPARLEHLLASSAFGPIRERLGPQAFEALCAERLRPLVGDLAAGAPEIASDVDLVIHSAATVSFDPPIGEAFETNLVGTLGLREATRGLPFLHVSTAYVAGVTRGFQPEEPLRRDVDWRAELDAARRMHADVEFSSRSPEVLARLEARARREVGKAGPQSVAARTEELRRRWVTDRLVKAGGSRARSLGWPDVYTFTKALTEIALDAASGEDPLAIVRPSIIESALTRPYPGWIEGFRMADPIILAYGRGALPDFPGIPEGVLDVIPVDLVVNTMLAVAARLAAGTEEPRAIYHSCSGSRNPLTFRGIYENTRAYYLRDPLPERGRGAYKVPVWSFPGRRAVESRIATAGRMLERAETLVGRIPRGRAAREAARRVDRLRGRFDFVKRYAGLYGPYVEAEVIYTDDRTKALYESLSSEDRADFPFDPSAFTWTHYLREVHIPAISSAMRWMAPRRTEPRVALRPNGTVAPVLAVFDVEGTIVASNVVESYLWLRLAGEDGVGRAREIAAMARRLPKLLAAERRDRGEFLRSFYRLYEGADADAIREIARAELPELLLRRTASGAIRRIREHRAAGHRIVLITGSLDFIAEALEPLADEVVAASLQERGGRFIGDLTHPPLVGEGRASWLREYAKGLDADLESSYAYADSMSDLPLLEAVGTPVAVNPDVALARIARTRKWPVEEWEQDRGTPRVLLPEGAMR